MFERLFKHPLFWITWAALLCWLAP